MQILAYTELKHKNRISKKTQLSVNGLQIDTLATTFMKKIFDQKNLREFIFGIILFCSVNLIHTIFGNISIHYMLDFK